MANEPSFADAPGAVAHSEDNYSPNHVPLLAEDENEETCETTVCSPDVKIFHRCEKDRAKRPFPRAEVGNENCRMGASVPKTVPFAECEDDCPTSESAVGHAVTTAHNVAASTV